MPNSFHFQREQDMRMGDMGPRGAINMGGRVSADPADSCVGPVLWERLHHWDCTTLKRIHVLPRA